MLTEEENSLYALHWSESNLPMPHTLSRKQVISMAMQIANQHKTSKASTTVKRRKHIIKSNIYGIEIKADTHEGAIAKSCCFIFWKRELEKKANLSRLNHEAHNKLIGGPYNDTEVYSSNATVARMREKRRSTEETLSKLLLKNTRTGEEFSMLEVASSSESNRFNELYSFTKNFEEIAKENGMPWIFVTLTAPPEFHPNPINPSIKHLYNPDLGVRASHEHICHAWQKTRSLLNKRNIKASPYTYFGARTTEPHKDGCIHWHKIVFIMPDLISAFEHACKAQFPHPNQIKIVVGDETKGRASTYVFKYMMKQFDQSSLDESIRAKVEEEYEAIDNVRESSDLASIKNGERVRACIQALGIRQYQTFGILRVTTLLRKINKLDLAWVSDHDTSPIGYIKSHVWRNPLALKNLLKRPELFNHSEHQNPPVKLIKEEAHSRYGEERDRIIGIEIDGAKFISKGIFKIVRPGHGYSYI